MLHNHMLNVHVANFWSVIWHPGSPVEIRSKSDINVVEVWSKCQNRPIWAQIRNLCRKCFTTAWSTSILLISEALFDPRKSGQNPVKIRSKFVKTKLFYDLQANLSSDSQSLQKMLHNGMVNVQSGDFWSCFWWACPSARKRLCWASFFALVLMRRDRTDFLAPQGNVGPSN